MLKQAQFVLFLLALAITAQAGDFTLTLDKSAPQAAVAAKPALYKAATGDNLYLPLPDGAVFQGQVTSIIAHSSGNHTLFLQAAPGTGEGRAHLTLLPDGRMLGGAIVNGNHYRLRPGTVGSLVERSVTSQKSNLANDVVDAPESKLETAGEARKLDALPRLSKSAGTPVVSIAMAYTPKIADKYPGAALQAYFDDLEAYANQALITSDADMQVDIVSTTEVSLSYKDGTDIYEALKEIKEGNSSVITAEFRDDATAARADLTGFVVNTTTVPAGKADRYLTPGSNTYGAFAMTDKLDMPVNTFAHEIGHLLGGQHEIADVPDDGYYFDSHGFYTANGDGTIMAGIELPRFSNPSQTCPGSVPCGDENANMVRTLNTTAPIVAAGGDVLSDINFNPFINTQTLGGFDGGRGSAALFTVIALPNPSGNKITGGSWTVELRQGATVVKTFTDPFYYGEHTGYDPEADESLHYTLYPGPDVAPGAGYTIYLKSNAVSPDLDAESDPFTITAPAPVAKSLQVVEAGENYLTLSVKSHGNGTETIGTFAAQVDGGGSSFTSSDLDVDWKAIDKTYTGTISGLPCNTAFDIDFTAASAQGADVAGPKAASTSACTGGAAPSAVSLTADPDVAASDFTVTATLPGDTGEVTVYVMGGQNASATGSAAEFADGIDLSVSGLACETAYQAQATVKAEGQAAVSNLASFTTGSCAAGTAGFADLNESGEEGDTVTLTVQRAQGSTGAASVHYSTSTGTAGSGDFTAVSGTLNWSNGDTADKTIEIALSADSTTENDETFTVTLSDPAGMMLDANRATATVTVQNKAGGSGGGGNGDGNTPPPSGDSGGNGGGGGSAGLFILAGLGLLVAKRKMAS